MPINYNKLYEEQLREMSDILELINYRPRTIESYLRSISECCEWLGSTFGILCECSHNFAYPQESLIRIFCRKAAYIL